MFPFPSNSSSNNSSRNPTPRRGPPQQASSATTPRIPQAAYELLHKKYDRPKSQVEMMKLREKIQKQEQEEKRQQRLLRQKEKRERNHQDQYGVNKKSGQSTLQTDDYDESEPLQLRAEDGSILKKSTSSTPQKHSSSNHQNENKTINSNNITNLPGSAIQRLPFKSFDDILMSENADENDKNSNKTDGIIDAASLYQNSALSYQEMMKKFRSQRSHIHRTWEAVDAEQAHERRSRAIKRSFTTCQMTPAWDPNEAAKKQKKQQQKLALDQETNNNNDSRSGSSTNSSTTTGRHDKRNKPFSILPADDGDDDDNSYGDRLSPVLSPFSSRILRYEMQHATVSSPNATRKQQQEQEERDNNNNDNHRKRRMYREIDSRFPQQQYMEERARAKFMAEVMKRRELENLEDTMDVASQLREKDRQKQLELEAERDRNNQIRNAMEQEGIPPGMKRNRKGDVVPKKYKLVSAKSSKSQGVSIRSAGEDIVGLLSPVGVMAKALGHQHHQVYDPSEEFDDDDDDDENQKEKWVTDSDDDDNNTDMLLSDPFWKRQQKLQKLINPDEEPEENVDEAGQKLWTFDDGYEKKKDPSSQNNKNRFVPKNPTEMQLDEEDAEHEAARAKVKLASLFQRDPPAELLDEIKKPPPSQRRKKEIDDEMMENPDSDGINNQRSQKGRTTNPNLTKTRKRDDQDDDFVTGNFEFIDPNSNNDEDDTSNQNDANRRRRAAAWRRAKAAMNDGMSDIARELAMKYWNMRMNYVDQDVEKFHHNNNNYYGVQQQSTNVNNSSFASSSGGAGVHQDLLPSSSVSFSSPTLLRQESLLNSKSFSAEFHRHQQHQQPLLSSTSQSTAPSSPSASFVFRQKVTNTINAADDAIPDVAADENSPKESSSPASSSVVFFRSAADRDRQQLTTTSSSPVSSRKPKNDSSSVTAFSTAKPGILSSLEQMREARKTAEEKVTNSAVVSRSASFNHNNNTNNSTASPFRQQRSTTTRFQPSISMK